jgi:integrase
VKAASAHSISRGPRTRWFRYASQQACPAAPSVQPPTPNDSRIRQLDIGRRNRRQRVADVTTSRLTTFVTTLRAENAAEATIAHHLRHLKAAMRWAHRQGLLLTLPQFTMPKRVNGAKIMRGRPITGEEFDRMISAVPRGIEARPTTAGADAVTPWRFYLNGLWESGLRLNESLTLRWDDSPDAIVVDLSSRQPILRIPAEAEKGNKDRLLPITPEFPRCC